MSKKETEEVFREISAKIIELHKKDESISYIASIIENYGLTYQEAKILVERVTTAYKKGIDLSEKPSFLDRHRGIREIVYFVGGVALVLVGVLILTFILGLCASLFEAIGLGEFGEVLVSLGGNAAGVLLGALGTAASSENRSPGMFIGCWVGSGLYYWWLFSSM